MLFVRVVWASEGLRARAFFSAIVCAWCISDMCVRVPCLYVCVAVFVRVCVCALASVRVCLVCVRVLRLCVSGAGGGGRGDACVRLCARVYRLRFVYVRVACAYLHVYVVYCSSVESVWCGCGCARASAHVCAFL